ncbi:MAG: hypothetical protein JO142_13500 [Burkholderiales bacterium]|nr:hypothetical protein [Burkholderiales bacterium]
MKPTHLLPLPLILIAAPLFACTLWGATGSASAGGTLLAKNRDWMPDHVQSVRMVHPEHGLSYIGLYAEGSRVPGLKQGVNEAGLSVVGASASSLPRAVRNAEKAEPGLLRAILSSYHNLDEIETDAPRLFAHRHPDFFLLADARGLMQVEIGLHGHYAIRRGQDGTFTHTNHYLDTSVIDEPQKIGESSATRLGRIQSLLTDAHGKHTLAEFEQISKDRHDGPDDSLWRNGRESTLAGWQIALPADGAPRLHLLVANPGAEQQTADWTLDKAFWAQPAGVLLGGDTRVQ